ncbi:MAG: class I SAM-dependent RNA methyltransferase [Deltaproteobacteria bacterium]|nr:class I SAM-dependent RNA methyltransferase [Deltaproteobacteria bacterium]
MRLLEGRHHIVIPCSPGIAPFLARELRDLKMPVIEERATSVSTKGDFADVVRLNLNLCTGQRVLWRLASFTASDPDQLYEKLMPLNWEELVPVDGYFSVTSVVETPTIRDSRFANLRVKDAIVDRLRRCHGRRPDSGPLRDQLVFHLFWQQDEVKIYLDTSGPTLAQRGYRLDPGKAPLRETLAAALILASGWRGAQTFINPMCGSGTLAIEAALLAQRRIPGLLRQHYSFQSLAGYKNMELLSLRAQALREARPDRKIRLIASDHDPLMIKVAKENAVRAGVAGVIEFITCDFAETPVPSSANPGGVLLCNPEYGVRLGEEEELKITYRRLGDFLKQKAAGYEAFIFSGNRNLLKEVGLRPARRWFFDNGGIPCELAAYPLYAGSQTKPETVSEPVNPA